MRAKYVLNEALVGLWRNVTMTIAMIITMSVSLLGLGFSVLGYMQINKMKDVYYGDIQVAIFLKTDVTTEQRAGISAQLDANPLISEKRYEDKDAAYKRFQELYADSPDLLKVLRPDSLPESYRVKLKDPEGYDAFSESIKGVDGIQDVVDQGKLLGRIFDIFGTLQLVALIAASVMAAAALLLVGNTIQVAAYSKRREVAVMKLVGASNWFIQAPFVLEAVVAGFVGAIVGWLGLLGIKVFLFDGPLQSLTTILTPIPMGNVFLMLPLMAGVGALVGAVTASITLRFYLRI
jgi:cell division transport system permease protein